MNLIEIGAYQQHREFSIKHKGTEINLLLPRVDVSVDVRKYIAEELGKLLYDILKEKLGTDYVTKELNRYIPETREVHISTRNLFAEYFYDVVLYQERKPGIYPNFDDHMKRVMTLGFFEKIIGHYLKE